MDTKKKLVLISIFNKTEIISLAENLLAQNYSIIASDGTASYLQLNNIEAKRISDFTKSPELLGGRVKTLHPAIFAGILSRDINTDIKDLVENKYEHIDIVVCNLYPFSSVTQKSNCTEEDAIENIDIGGVALLRAAAKNHRFVTVLCDQNDYKMVVDEIKNSELSEVSLETRRKLALKAFTYTCNYDSVISDYLRKNFQNNIYQLDLKYGINPHQKPAQIFNFNGNLPISVINGVPSYINLCDAFNGWQLVSELRKTLNLPAATSFKHVSPAGAAVASTLTENQIHFYGGTIGTEFSPLATAYIKARAGDPMSSFGDFIALSDNCDICTARIIAREVSDGIIAPKYDKESLEILKKKKGGSYCILQMDLSYEPPLTESRTIFGLTLEQKRNDVVINENLLNNIVTENKQLTEDAKKDLLLATITIKYTQSNSVCYAKNGQVIGIGAGQQSRIHCTRLAGDKANNWWLRQHPYLLKLKFKKNIKRADIANAIEFYITSNPDNVSEIEMAEFRKLFDVHPLPFIQEIREKWMKLLTNVSLSSDAFFPFRDNIDRASQTGVKYIISSSGSINDSSIIAACNQHNMVLVHTNLRLFHH